MATFGFCLLMLVFVALSSWIIYLQGQLAVDMAKLTKEMADRLVKLEKAQSSEG